MEKKKLVLGIATGVALLSATAYMVYRKRKSSSASNESATISNLVHDGRRLAERSRHKAEQLASSMRKESNM